MRAVAALAEGADWAGFLGFSAAGMKSPESQQPALNRFR
jgi:hypothetical protein